MGLIEKFKRRRRMSQISEYFGGQEPAVFSAMNSSPEYAAAQWTKYEAILSKNDEISRRDKELIGLGVAVAKPSPYMVKFQKERAKAAGADDAAIDATMKVIEFFEGGDAHAHLLRIDSDLQPGLLAGDNSTVGKEETINVPLVKESDDAIVNEVYEEIKKAFGLPFVPNFFMAMAHNPEFLRNQWNAYKVTMTTGGEPSRVTRELVAVAVSAVNGCEY